MEPSGPSRRPGLAAAAVLAAVVFALGLGLGASQARPARSGQVTLTMIAYANQQPSLGVLIPNFERAYPNITVDVSYAATIGTLDQLETTELATGNGPDLITTAPGCGQAVSVCVFAAAGYLAPIVKAPWLKRSVPLVTSLSKEGQGLFTFEPELSPYGVFTNDGLFSRFGLKIPQTFPELLDLCRKATADGTFAIVLAASNGTSFERLLEALAVPTVYAGDKHWTAQLRAGSVSFDGTPGWHTALSRFIDMNSAGCFEPGATGTTTSSAEAQFAQGQGLMYADTVSQKGVIDVAEPQFTVSFHPFPGGTSPTQTTTLINLNFSVSVNAHSSAENQAAAQTFIDFLARPAQNVLYARIAGGLTQYEFLNDQVSGFMSSFESVLKNDEYVLNPEETWWNPAVLAALGTYDLGLLTGQSTIDGVLTAMDAAWKQGPS